jgi:hypothetical protein
MEQPQHDGLTRPETLCFPFDRMNISTSGHRADDDRVLHAILDPEDEGISIDRDLHPDKDAFLAWEPFFLCSVVPGKDDERNEMLIHPVFGGRFAVPILSNGIHIDSKDKLQRSAINIAHMFSFVKSNSHLCVSVTELWQFVLRRLALKSFFSFNDMVGALVLFFSILHWLHLYVRSAKIQGTVMPDDGDSVVNDFLDTLASCKVALTEQMETSDNEMKARWQQALQITGYDPTFF